MCGVHKRCNRMMEVHLMLEMRLNRRFGRLPIRIISYHYQHYQALVIATTSGFKSDTGQLLLS